MSACASTTWAFVIVWFLIQDASKVATYRVLRRAGMMPEASTISPAEIARLERAVEADAAEAEAAAPGRIDRINSISGDGGACLTSRNEGLERTCLMREWNVSGVDPS